MAFPFLPTGSGHSGENRLQKFSLRAASIMSAQVKARKVPHDYN
jgi:hypothetical protein